MYDEAIKAWARTYRIKEKASSQHKEEELK